VGLTEWRKKRRLQEQDQMLREASSLLWESPEPLEEQGAPGLRAIRPEPTGVPGVPPRGFPGSGTFKPNNHNNAQAEADLDGLVNSLKERTLRALQPEIEILTGRLQLSCDATEALIARLERFQEGLHLEIEKGREVIQGAGRQALESLAKELYARVDTAFEAGSSNFLEQTRQLVKGEISRAVQGTHEETVGVAAEKIVPSLKVELEKSVQKSAEELSSLTSSLQQQIEITCHNAVEKAANSVDAAAGEVIARVQSVHREIESALEKTAGDQIAAQMASSTQAEVAKSLRKTAEEILSSSIEALREQAQATCLNAVRSSLDTIHTAAGEAVARTAAAVARTDGVLQKIEAAPVSAPDNQPEQGGDSAKPGIEELQQKADLLLGGLRDQLQDAVDGLCEKEVREALDQIHKATEDLLEHSGKQLKKLADDNVKATVERLNSFQKRLVAETMDQTVEVAQPRAKGVTEKISPLSDLPSFRETLLQRGTIAERYGAGVRGQVVVDPLWVSRMCLWAVGIAVSVLLFLGIAIHPVWHLRAEPPAEFLAVASRSSNERRLAEERLARAYWQHAARYVQFKYPFGRNLPDQPPPEFKQDNAGGAVSKASLDSSTRYWARLQRVWLLPQIWEKSYEWNVQRGWERIMRKIQTTE
jgi:hypothetical protein